MIQTSGKPMQQQTCACLYEDSGMRLTLKFGKNVCELNEDEYSQALPELGSGKPSTIGCMTKFVIEWKFGEPDDSTDGDSDSYNLLEGDAEDDEDAKAEDGALMVADAKRCSVQQDIEDNVNPEEADPETQTPSDEMDER